MNLNGDMKLAEKLENYAAQDDAAYVLTMKDLFPEKQYETFSFPGGYSCYAGNSPFTNTHGFGVSTEEHGKGLLKDIESFFDQFQCPTILSVSSVSTDESLKALFDKGYSPLGYRNIYVYTNQVATLSVETASIKIVEVSDQSEIDVWLRVVSNGFAGKELNEPDIISLGQSKKKGNRFFLAYVDGEVAAGSALYVNGEFARLGGMTTLWPFQKRGVQQLMIQHRVKLAIDLGCEIISSDTQPGNNSQRNLERNGFKLAYVRGIYRKAQA